MPRLSTESTRMLLNFNAAQLSICDDIDLVCKASEMYYSAMAKGLFYLLLGGLLFLIVIDGLLVVLLIEKMLSEQLKRQIQPSALFRNIIVKYFIPGFNNEDLPREETSFDASVTKNKNKKKKGKNMRNMSKDTKQRRPSKSIIVIEPGQRDLKNIEIGDHELQANTARSDKDSCNADRAKSPYKAPSQRTVNSLKYHQAKVTPNVSRIIGPDRTSTMDKTQIIPLIETPAKSLMAKTPRTDVDMDKTQNTSHDQ